MGWTHEQQDRQEEDPRLGLSRGPAARRALLCVYCTNGKRKSGGGKARKTVKPTKTATRKAARRSEG